MILECARLVLHCNLLQMENISKQYEIMWNKTELNMKTVKLCQHIHEARNSHTKQKCWSHWTTVNLMKSRIQWSLPTKGDVRSLIHANETMFTRQIVGVSVPLLWWMDLSISFLASYFEYDVPFWFETCVSEWVYKYVFWCTLYSFQGRTFNQIQA